MDNARVGIGYELAMAIVPRIVTQGTIMVIRARQKHRSTD
jgi:hypothetical protein